MEKKKLALLAMSNSSDDDDFLSDNNMYPVRFLSSRVCLGAGCAIVICDIYKGRTECLARQHTFRPPFVFCSFLLWPPVLVILRKDRLRKHCSTNCTCRKYILDEMHCMRTGGFQQNTLEQSAGVGVFPFVFLFFCSFFPIFSFLM